MTILPLRPSCTPEPDGIPTQEDHRARFYEVYHKVAEEYDKEFLKKHDGDLNTTPIFVSDTPGLDGLVLTMGTGWSFLCSHLRIHHPGHLLRYLDLLSLFDNALTSNG